jgi:DNA-binding HxlR family transcriptional regulator
VPSSPTWPGGDLVRASSVTRALNVLGEVWTVLLIKEAFEGARRFQAFQERLGIPRQTLMRRLSDLTEQQIFYKKPVQHRTLIYEYRLTAKGLDLYPFVLSVWCWHRRWNPRQSFLPARLMHRPCGHALSPRFICGACHADIGLEDVVFEDRDLAFDARPPQRLSRLKDAAVEKAMRASDPLPVALSLIGDRWSSLVLQAIFMGTRNFFALQEELKIASNVLSSRLKKLVALDLAEARAGRDRRKLDYDATPRGRDIYPMLQTLASWGDRWLAGPDGPPQLRRHRGCGAILDPHYVCGHCGQVVRAPDVVPSGAATKH